jgi:dipeptidyl-peptidase-3
VLGHASGQVDPSKVQGDPSKYLKEYDNTLEEARADLVALWHAYDPALAELSADHDRIAEQMYRDFLGESLSNLHRVDQGDSFEEDHMRGHHMTVGFLIEKGAVKQVAEKGKTYWVATDFKKMREGVGELLTRLMTIKATGDYAGIKALVEKYGIKFDPRLRDELVKRVKAVDVPRVLLMVSPRLHPVLNEKGELKDLEVSHAQSLIEQHLERSLLGSLPPEDATRVAAGLDGSVDSLRKAFKELGSKAPAAMPPTGGTTAPQPKKTGP